jgi:predicted Zn-dependent peptidase
MTISANALTDEAIARRTLPNGLRALCVALPHVHRAAVSVHVQSGSRFEPVMLGGISHFHEHMLHRGTRTYPTAHTLALAFEDLGSELGAATYVDHTVLSANSPIENLGAVIALLGELVSAPVFSGIEIERGIVREEILESLNEKGEPVDADELLIALAFPEHGLGRPITGTIEAVERFDVPTLHTFHRENYRADSMVVSVVGPIDVNQTFDAVERAFASLTRGTPRVDIAPAELAGPVFRYVNDVGSQTALRVAFRAPSERDPLEPATELLLRTLDDGMSTRLYHEVCDERGLAYDVSATYEAFGDSGMFSLAGEAAHGSAEKLLTALFGVASDLGQQGPSAAELDKAKRRFAWQMRAVLDDPAELAAFLGLGELTAVARSPEARSRELEAVRAEDVQAAARRVFAVSGLAVAAVGDLRANQQKALERLVRSFR